MIQSGTRVSVGDVFSAASDVFGAHLRALAIGGVALVVVNIGIDLLPITAGKQSLASIVSFLIQYQLYALILRSEGLIGEGVSSNRYLALLGSSIVSAIGVTVGMVLLVLPGLILLARWSIAPGMVIAEGQGPIASLSESWRATKASQWPIVGAFVVFGIVWLVLFGVLFSIIGFGAADLGSAGSALTFNLASAALTIASICVSLGIYRLVRVSAAQLDDVFG